MTSRTGKPHVRQENRRERRRRRVAERAIETGARSSEQREAWSLWHRARYEDRKADRPPTPAIWDAALEAWTITLPGRIHNVSVKGTITV